MHRFTRFAVAAVAAIGLAAGGVGIAVGAPGGGSPNDNPGAPIPDSNRSAFAIAAAGPVGPSGSRETVFVPITPCRIVDTRISTGPFASGMTRTFYAAGTSGFAAQGGTSAGCGIPQTATAIAATFTAVSPSNVGFFRAWPDGVAEPGATLLNYSKATNIGTGATVAVRSSTAGKDLAVKNYGGPSQLVIDVTGYYDTQIHAVLSYNGGIYSGSSRVLSSTRTSTGSYQVEVAGNLAGCTPIASIYGSAYFASAYISGGTIFANTYAPNGTLTDLYWTLEVNC